MAVLLEYDTDPNARSKSGTTRYIWGGDSNWQCLEERDGSNDLVARYTYSPGYIDAVAVQERDLNSDDDFGDDDEVIYYHGNTLHSAYCLTDDAENVVERYRYDAYGGCTVLDADGSDDSDNASDVDNPFLFTGRRLDSEWAGMQYRHRSYSTTLGRFISRDPAGYHDGPSLYCYVGGRPAAGGDPLGLEGEWDPERCTCGADISQVLVDHYNAFISQEVGGASFSAFLASSQHEELIRGNAEAIYRAAKAIGCMNSEECVGTVEICGKCFSGYHIDHLLWMVYLAESYGVKRARAAGQFNESFFIWFWWEGRTRRTGRTQNPDLAANEVGLCISRFLAHADAAGGTTDLLSMSELCSCIDKADMSVIGGKDRRYYRGDPYGGYVTRCKPCGVQARTPSLTLPPIEP